MDKLTIPQFGATIKQKYPQYSGLSDYEVGQKTLEKYPQYHEKVIFTHDMPDVIKTPAEKSQNLANAKKNAEVATKEAKKAKSPLGFLGNVVKGVGNTIIASEKGLGETIATVRGAKNLPTYTKNIESLTQAQIKTSKAIKDFEARGKDSTDLKRAYNDIVTQIQENKKSIGEYEKSVPTTGKVLGQVGGTALDILTAGTYGKAATGAKTGVLSRAAVPTAKKVATATGLPELGKLAETKASGLFTKKGVINVAKGAGIGYASDVTQGLQGMRGEDRTGEKAFIPGLGTAIGVGIPAISEGRQSFKNLKSPERVKTAVNDLEQRYTEWSTGTKPGKKYVSKVQQKTEAMNRAGTSGKTPMRVLAESGIVPELKGTKFNTFDQAEGFRNTITPLRTANKAALKEAQLSTAPTKLADLEAKAIEFAKTPENVNGGRFETMQRDIRKQFALLRNAYPSGEIPLGVVDDIKSARWDNVFKNKGLIEADVLKKDSEYAIAKALQKSIEETAEKAGHTEVAQLNREIGDRLEAARFLETLDGKTLKGGRVGKYVGTLIGSSLGQTIPGKIIGAVGGNVVADLLIKSSVQSPVRRAILRNLETADPEAYQMTLKWLAEQDALRSTRLALPPGRPGSVAIPTGGQTFIGGKVDASGKPINPPQSGAQVLPAMKNPVSVNPKTKKFQTSYSSKSPNAQQTSPATTNVIKKPISRSLPQNKKK